jgi:hypothetical protein
MVRTFAIALLAASVFTAPAFARSDSHARTRTTITTPAQVVPVRHVVHFKKHKRYHHRYTHVRHFHAGKAVSSAPAIAYGKRGARI